MAIRSIGFIGLGEMGFPMAKRLCKAGFELRTAVYRGEVKYKDAERAEILAGMGVKVLDGFAAAVRGADLVLTILPQDEQVKGVLLDPEVFGAIAACPKGIILEMTSCTPQTVQEIGKVYGEKGVRVFDGPVSGGTAGAENGTLTVFGSGPAGLLEELRPVLDVLAAKVYHVGELGAGKGLKAINQLLAAVNMAVLAEGYALAKAQGIDADVMYEVIKESAGNSYVFDKKFRNLAAGNFPAGFKLSLMRKDLRIALSLEEKLDLPLSKLAYEFYSQAEEFDNCDYSAIAKFYEEKIRK